MGQGYSLALFQAASQNDTSRIRLLLNQGADVNSVDEENGWTALHHAVWAGNGDAARELLVGGAKVDARDNELKTPLHYAVLGGHESIMQALCNHGAAVNAADNCGQTPLHKAAAQGQLTLAQELIARGADENARLQDGSTPIHLASWKGHIPVLEYLLESGANLDAVNLEGDTALHEAARSGKDGACQVLIKRGANTSALNNNGETPADVAQQSEHFRTATLLAPDLQSVEKERAMQEHRRRTARSSAQPSTPSAPQPSQSERVTYPVIDPPSAPLPGPPGGKAAESLGGKRYGLPDEDADSDDWEPRASEEWEGVEAPTVMESQGGRLMSRLEQQPPASGQQGDPFWMIPGPIKWAAGSLGGVLNNVNPFKSPRQPPGSTPSDAEVQESLENALEKKTAQVSELRKSETHQELSAAQLKRLKEQEDEIALLKRQLNAREQGQDVGSSHNHQPASSSAAGPSKSASARHHIIDLPPAQAPAARLVDAQQIQEATNGFAEKLHDSSAGSFFRGTLEGADVAVLVPKDRGYLPEAAIQEAAAKLAGLTAASSGGELVHLRAYSADGCAVYDLQRHGSVEDSLRSRTPALGSKPVRLEWKSRLAIALKTAQGLLELRKAGLHHTPAGLCPSKVLVTDSFDAKLLTPGIPALITGPQGPSKHASYIAPEVREGGAQSVQSDVFSFGLFLLQLITGSEASGLVQYTESALRQGKLASLLDPCAEGITSSSALPLAQLALRCAAYHPEERPDLEHEVLPAIFNLQEVSEAPAGALDEDPPEHLICPITQEVMMKPVILSDGYTYEESAIRQWLSTGKQVSPMTNQQLDNLILTPNYVIKSAASTWREKHPEAESEAVQHTEAKQPPSRIEKEVSEMNSLLQNGRPTAERRHSGRENDPIIIEDDLPSAPTHTHDSRAERVALHAS